MADDRDRDHAEDLDITSAVADDIAHLRLAGELDVRGADHLLARFDEAVGRGATSARVHLNAVEFVDSSGLSALLRIRERVLERGGVLELVRPSEPVTRLIRLTGLDEILTILEE